MANIDVATLSIRVRHEEVDRATQAMGYLQKQGVITEYTFNNVAKASGGANAGLGQMGRSLAAVTSQVAGLNPQLARQSALLGEMALGSGPMIAVLAGVAALGFAYEKWMDKVRKTKEEHEKLLAVLDRLRDKEKYSLEAGVETARADLLELTRKRDALLAKQAGNGIGGVFAGGGGFGSELVAINAKIKEQIAYVKRGEDDLARIAREAEDDRQREVKRSLDARERELEEYKRLAEKREKIAFEEAQKLALYARVAAGFAQLGPQNTGGGGFPYFPSAAKLPGAPEDPRSSLAIETQNEWIRRLVEQQRYAAEQTEQAWTDAFDVIQQHGEGSFRQIAELAQRVLQSASKPGTSGGETAGLGGLGSQMIGDALGAVGGALPFIGGVVSLVNGQMQAARIIREAAETFKRSVNDWAAENAGTGAQTIAGLRARREALLEQGFAGLGRSYADSKGRTLGVATQAIVDQANALFEQNKTRLLADALREIGDQFNELGGAAGSYLSAQNQIIDKYLEQKDILEALGATQEDLTRIEALRDQKLAQLVNSLEQAASSSLLGRLGLSSSSSTPFLGDSKNGGWFDLFGKYVDSVEATKKAAEESAYWDKFSAQIQQESLNKLTDSLNAQDDVVKNTRQTYEALKRYSDSLNLSGLSPLSPTQRYTEAKNQYNVIKALAASGDKSALASLPDTANAFLTESRNVYASSKTYQTDFLGVRSFINDITAQYGDQLTTQEKILAELQRQTAIAQASLTAQASSTVQQLVDAARRAGGGADVQRISGMLRQLGYQLGVNSIDLGNGTATLGTDFFAIPTNTAGGLPGQSYTEEGGTVYTTSSAILGQLQQLNSNVSLLGDAIKAVM